MKILIIGLGSIGQRHLFNLKKIFKKSSFYALRKIKKKIIIKETRIIKKSDPIKYFNIRITEIIKLGNFTLIGV